MILFVVALLAAIVLFALAVVSGFVTIYKKWDNWSALISIGVLLCVPVLLYLIFILVMLNTGGIGGTLSSWLVIVVLLSLLVLVVVSVVAVGIILRRIIKVITMKLKLKRHI